MKFKRSLQCTALLTIGFLSSNCATKSKPSNLVVSVTDQRLSLIQNGQAVKTYPVSTSKFGLGDSPGSNKTPLGTMRVYQKVGTGAKTGTVFKSRRPTGEIVKPGTNGRDPIVTRIMWLDGLQHTNQNARSRFIYIHGTPEEAKIGTPASYGCIRMKSKDIEDLYDRVSPGSLVKVTTDGLSTQEVPKQESQLYAAVLDRETRQKSSQPVLQHNPLHHPDSSSSELMAAAAPQEMEPPQTNPSRSLNRSVSASTQSGSWQLSEQEMRAAFER